MIKNLVFWLTTLPNFIIAPTLTPLASNNNLASNNSIEMINKNITIDGSDLKPKSDIAPNSTSKDLNLKGSNSEVLHRIFMDSSNDKSLPSWSNKKTNDYIIGKGKKNDWYSHKIHGLTLNTRDYAKGKQDFLQQYKVITFSYSYNYNLWNSKKGWSFQYGKNSPLVGNTQSYSLTSQNTEYKIFEKTDSDHSNNEKVRLKVTQTWNGDILNYIFYMDVYYSWAAGSVIKHASLGQFTNDQYTFSWVPPYDEASKTIEIVDKLANDESKDSLSSEFKLSDKKQNINPNKLDEQIKNNAKEEEISQSSFRTTCLLMSYYYGSRYSSVTNVTYIYSLSIRWVNIPTRDSSLLLNNINISRTFSSSYSNGKMKFIYENNRGNKQETDLADIDSNFLEMNMVGRWLLPFIYLN